MVESRKAPNTELFPVARARMPSKESATSTTSRTRGPATKCPFGSRVTAAVTDRAVPVTVSMLGVTPSRPSARAGRVNRALVRPRPWLPSMRSLTLGWSCLRDGP